MRAECFSIDLFADCFSFRFGFSATPCKVGIDSFRLLVCVHFSCFPSYPARIMFSQKHPFWRSKVYVST